MPRECTVCNHPNAIDINTELVVERRALRDIAGRYGFSKSTIDRHKAHIPELLVQASRAEELAGADLLLDKLEGLEEEARIALDATKAAGEWKTFLSAIGEIRENVKLLAQVSGKLKEIQINNTQVNIAIDARTQQVILEALEPHPEARIAVAQALRELEDVGVG